jgi:hypothetical protein
MTTEACQCCRGSERRRLCHQPTRQMGRVKWRGLRLKELPRVAPSQLEHGARTWQTARSRTGNNSMRPSSSRICTRSSGSVDKNRGLADTAHCLLSHYMNMLARPMTVCGIDGKQRNGGVTELICCSCEGCGVKFVSHDSGSRERVRSLKWPDNKCVDRNDNNNKRAHGLRFECEMRHAIRPGGRSATRCHMKASV